MFTHKTGSFLQGAVCPSHCLAQVKGWLFMGKDSTKHKAYCFFNSILKGNGSFPTMLTGATPLMLGANGSAQLHHTTSIHRKGCNSFQVLAPQS